MNKRLISIVISFAMAVSAAIPANADEQADLEASRDTHYYQLELAEERAYDLSVKRQNIQNQIAEINYDLVDTMIEISQAEEAITTTETSLKAKRKEIKETIAKLEAAETKRDQQYEDMQLRIQYIYENGGDAGWAISILESSDLTQFFNKAEYAQQVEESDRKALDELKSTVTKIHKLKTKLVKERKELQAQKSDLETQKAALDEREYELSVSLEQKQAAAEDYSWQIAEAREQANALSSIIAEETAEIRYIQIEKEKEAERLAKEREEAARLAAQAADEDEADYDEDDEDSDEDDEDSDEDDEDSDEDDEDYNENDEDSDEDDEDSDEDDEDSDEDNEDSDEDNEDYDEDDEDSDEDDEDYDEDYDEDDLTNEDDEYYDEDYEGSDEDYDDDDEDYSSGSEADGERIVAYADQFVGNPYVWGGSSLTNGCDCSHFVWLVLRDLGYYTGQYITSGEFPYYGEAVSGLSSAQAGDVIVYSGHVAIYDGYGGIVEAKGAKWGITHDRSADHGPILAIRRFV